jgi:serine/threonine-protein kinase
MGEVYRARDTRLERSVAVKVLPDAHAADADFRSRFEREARTIAALSHPHICAVYDVGHHQGSDYIVMEFVEGTTLADRLKKQRLGVDEAIGYAMQIAEALEEAHRAGIVHRDLKPANVMITKSGVKLVDFGLAKTGAPIAGLSALSTSPGNLTAQGTILGTLQYMAPEQVEGADADARTDIFAFGAVLYEMVTGRKAFEAKTAASLLGAILRDQPPPIATLQPLAPRALDRVVSACLAKDPAERWQSARDLRRELQWIAEAKSEAGSGSPASRGDRAPARWLVAGLVGAAAFAGVAVGWWSQRPERSAPVVTRWTFPTSAVGNSARVAVSRDARAVVYEAIRPDGVQQLYVRRRDQLEPAPIRGTEGAQQLALSPGADWVLFVAGSQLRKVPIDGGPVASVCAVPANVVGLSWGPRDEIVFGSTDGLYRVPAAGGVATLVTRVDASAKEAAHGWPVILADGRTIVFTISRAAVPEIAVTSIAGDAPRTIVRGTHPRMTAAGDLLFSRGATVWATRLDANFTRVVREPVPVVEGVASLLIGYSAFDIAANGTLVYRPRVTQSLRLVWVDRQGRTSPATAERFDGTYHGPPALSPNGRRLAVSKHPTNGVDQIAIYDLQRDIQTALTGVSGTSRWPVWTPDGARLTFASEREGSWDLFEVPASGVGAAEPLLLAEGSQWPWSWSRDGQTLSFISGQVGEFDVWFLPRGGTPSKVPTAAGSRMGRIAPEAQFSPDGKWIAYQSDESGRMEVYIRTIPPSGNGFQVSTAGGSYPAWSRDGGEILYIAGEDRLMSVAVRFAAEPVLAEPVELFRLQFANDGSRPYDVAADGRLIAVQDTSTTPSSIVVVEGWTEELGRLLAAR